jgi:hypothetical protein
VALGDRARSGYVVSRNAEALLQPERGAFSNAKKCSRSMGFSTGTITALSKTSEDPSFHMTIEEWEAVHATLLWINLRSGLLPLGAEVERTSQKKPRIRGSGPQAAGPTREGVSIVRRSAGTETPASALLQRPKPTGLHRLRLMPYLRLVWSREKQSGGKIDAGFYLEVPSSRSN